MNDQLSPREHADMRDLVMAGAQRIRPVGKHRMQIVAGAAAFVLIAGIAGGAVAAASLLGADAQPAPIATATATITPVPTRTPTPSVSPTAAPPAPTPESEPDTMFDGACADVVTEAEATEVVGKPMVTLAAPWSPGADRRLGGITCRWSTRDEYMGAEVSVYVYPSAVVQASEIDGPDSCVQAESWTRCSATTVETDVWVSVTASIREPEGTVVPLETLAIATDDLLALVSSRARAYSSVEPSMRTDGWWVLDGCAAIAADLEESGAIQPGTVVHDSIESSSEYPRESIPGLLGLHRACAIERGWSFQLWPGGADRFDDVAALEASEPVEINGAVGAIVAPSLDAYEGHYPELVISDGHNLLAVTVYGYDGAREEDIVFAGLLLEVMSQR